LGSYVPSLLYWGKFSLSSSPLQWRRCGGDGPPASGTLASHSYQAWTSYFLL
jgi:hypothetical protein